MSAESAQDVADDLYKSGLRLSGLLITDTEDPLGQTSRFVLSPEGYKYVDAKCKTENFDPAKAAEAHAKNLFHSLWGKAKVNDGDPVEERSSRPRAPGETGTIARLNRPKESP